MRTADSDPAGPAASAVRVRGHYRLPEDKAPAMRRARRLEWATLGFMASIVAVVGWTMGSSQAMKAAWIEDLLSLVPPLAFLVAARYQDRPPNPKFPYGYRRAMSISFLIAATALLAFGAFILVDSVLSLAKAEHPVLGTLEILGVEVWAGWPMIGALAYSMVPPMLLGRLKLPLARELHEKTLHADAAMNKADWLTGGAGILGVLGIGIGWWWADAVAAGVISFEITRDGIGNLKSVIEDLMDRRPMTVDRKEVDRLPDRARQELEKLPWVERAAIRLREEGQVLVGEAFVVPSDASDLPQKLVRASEHVQALHWRLHEIVITAVPSLPAGSASGSPVHPQPSGRGSDY